MSLSGITLTLDDKFSFGRYSMPVKGLYINHKSLSIIETQLRVDVPFSYYVNEIIEPLSAELSQNEDPEDLAMHVSDIAVCYTSELKAQTEAAILDRLKTHFYAHSRTHEQLIIKAVLMYRHDAILSYNLYINAVAIHKAIIMLLESKHASMQTVH